MQKRLKSFRIQSILLVLFITANISCKDDKKTIQISNEKHKKDSIAVAKRNAGPPKKAIYLTVDDGPVKGTDEVIKIANQLHVPITAFLIGVHINMAPLNKNLYLQEKNNPLFEICNHSFTHANYNHYNSFYNNPAMVVADFNRTEDTLKIHNKIARTPGRNIWRLNNIRFSDNKKSSGAADALEKAGYKLIGWDAEWSGKHERLKESTAEMLTEIKRLFARKEGKTPGHIVILTHDRFLRDAESSRKFTEFIRELQKTDEYEFRKISDYPGVSAVK